MPLDRGRLLPGLPPGLRLRLVHQPRHPARLGAGLPPIRNWVEQLVSAMPLWELEPYADTPGPPRGRRQ